MGRIKTALLRDLGQKMLGANRQIRHTAAYEDNNEQQEPSRNRETG
jgi:hypothetical protein